MKNTFFYLLICLVAAFLSGCSTSASKKPNILFILTDDQGWGDLAFHGNDTLDTPNLDWLAENSTEFTRFYVSPVCAPTRASILTGRYHLATGTSWVTHRTEVMREQEVTIAEVLKADGYRTGLFGKWHNGKQYPHDPTGQGFEEFFGFTEGHLNNYFDSKLTHHQEEVQTTGYVANLLADRAMSFMEAEGPFFCMLSLNTPHSPFQVPDKYFDKYAAMGLSHKNAAVYGMVENIDDIVGEMLQKLEELQKEKETIVIFMTDNGPNGVRYNGGFKGIKAHVDEGGVRVPFLVRYPANGWDKGAKISQLAGHIDLLPTLAELGNIALSDTLDIHGKSLVPLLNGVKSWPERMFFTHQVVRKFDTIPAAVRTHQYLLTLKPDGTGLYDLLVDPFQNENLADSLPLVVGQLKESYLRWFEEVNERGIVPEPIQVGHTGVSQVELPAPDVSRREEVTFEGGAGWANDWLVGWSNESEAAWELLVVDTATYGVYVEMASESGSPYNIRLALGDQVVQKEIAAQLVARQIDSPDRVKRGEVYEKKWPLVFAGNIKVTPGLNELRIGVNGFSGGSIDVKSVRLRVLLN